MSGKSLNRRAFLKRMGATTGALYAATTLGSGLLVPSAYAQTGVLRAAWQNEWDGFDPHIVSTSASFQVLNNVIDTLTTFTDNTQLVPGLATSWEQSEDGRSWTFHLRDDVRFSNGRQMTAEDVVFSLSRLTDPEIGSGNAGNAGGTDAQWEAVDPFTVRVTTPEPNGILPRLVGVNKATGIIAEESLEDDGTIQVPIGTGPFVIVDVDGTSRVRLEANPEYWEPGLPLLEAVEITPIPDEAAREAALLGGEVDWLWSVPTQSVDRFRSESGVVVGTSPDLSYNYMGLNLNREPFDDVRVRQALAMALDRQQIVEAAVFGFGRPLQEPIGPGLPEFNFNYRPYDRDLEQAQQLLADAGVGDGFEMELMPNQGSQPMIRAAEVMQQQLLEIGVTSEIFAPEVGEWLERQSGGEFDTFMWAWVVLIDPDQYYYLQHHSEGQFNFTGYANEEFDELVEQARQTGNTERRKELYEQANRILVDDAPYVYLYNPDRIQAWSEDVQGFVVRPDGRQNFKGVAVR